MHACNFDMKYAVNGPSRVIGTKAPQKETKDYESIWKKFEKFALKSIESAYVLASKRSTNFEWSAKIYRASFK